MFVFFSGSKSLAIFFNEPVPADDLGCNDDLPPFSSRTLSFSLPSPSWTKEDEEVEIEII